MECALREVLDEDLAVLFGQWADPVAAQMAAPLHARVAHDNVASRRVLEKCGFRVVGTDRGFVEARSREIDEIVLRLEQE